MTSSTADWVEIIDRLEAELDAVDAALGAGEAPRLARFTPPAHLPALPPALRPRLASIADRQAQVERAITDRLAVISGSMSASRPRAASDSGVAPRSAARFETRA